MQISAPAGSIIIVTMTTLLLGSGVDRAGAAEIGERLYQEHCASCHGANLEGQPEWQSPKEDGTLPAPPHDDSGHTWHHGDKLLFDYVKLGGAEALGLRGAATFKSGMPAFGDVLTDTQILQILAFIRSRWSEREARYQAEVSANE